MNSMEKFFLLLDLFGFNPGKFINSLRYFPYFLKQYAEFQNLEKAQELNNRITYYPILHDFDKAAGSVGGHYFYQDLWAARKIFQNRPKHHVDVGSRIDGFVAHVLTFMPVTVIDIRPFPSRVSGLSFVQSDATHLSEIPDNSVESLSCLHAVEHFGLGRYGDPIDPEACFTAMQSLGRVLREGGHLYFSVPIGREQIHFNAHRIFSPSTVLNQFKDLTLVSFSAIDDTGGFIENTNPDDYSNAEFACGLFEFVKEM